MDQGGDQTEAPKLVHGCRELAKIIRPGPTPFDSIIAAWHRLGIAESINPPDKRT